MEGATPAGSRFGPITWFTNWSGGAGLVTDLLREGRRTKPSAVVDEVARLASNLALCPLEIVSAPQAGPVADEAVVWYKPECEGDYACWDDVRGGWLPNRSVEVARQTELKWMSERGVRKEVPLSECYQHQRRPIPLKWVDTNKGSDLAPRVRSRLVVRDLEKAKPCRPTSSTPACLRWRWCVCCAVC